MFEQIDYRFSDNLVIPEHPNCDCLVNCVDWDIELFIPHCGIFAFDDFCFVFVLR